MMRIDLARVLFWVLIPILTVYLYWQFPVLLVIVLVMIAAAAAVVAFTSE